MKSKTIDCSQLSSSLRETYSLAEISANNNAEQSPSSFDAVRRFVLDKSPAATDLSSIFRNARDELRKINEGLLGGNSQKSNSSQQE